jgi:hypothetical protein
MEDFDLLDAVLPREGWFCVLGIKDKSVKQELVKTREELNTWAEKFVAQKRNVFFGCSKFETSSNRTKENVKAIKAFWMDIDCSPGKELVNPKTGKPDGYINQETGLRELIKFCKLIGMPRPHIVDSGRGFHVYWQLTEEVSKKEWEPVANKLRDLCVLHKFYVDGSVFEAARVLRIPGTFNFKGEVPLPVVVYDVGDITPIETFRELLHVEDAITIDFERPTGELNEFTKSLLNNTTKKFKNIMIRGEEGCLQLLHAYQNQNAVGYDYWRDVLSITAFCDDSHKASHMMCNKAESYDPAGVDAKVKNLQLTGAPHFCATFEKNNPNGCNGCKWKGKINTPIKLATELVLAPEEGKLEEEVVEYKIPSYPSPYLRGVTGGIYLPPGKDEADPVCVYEHDLYVVKLMEEGSSALALCRLHLPHGVVKEFEIPLVLVSSKEDLRKELATQGVAASPAQFGYLAGFMTAFIKNLQYIKRPEIMRTQFGWADNDSKFIVGDREISKDGTYGSPVSSTTKEIAKHMVPIGSYDKWREVFNMYRLPGLEPHAFAALTAFGAPLFKFTGLSGAIINVIYKLGGTGKSTTLFMCNSVWGHPEKLGSIWKDTNNAKIQKLGIMNNLPMTVDEITNISPQDFSDLAYSMSQGRGKDRMDGSSNALRKNDTTWQTMSLSSANASFYEKLASNKAGANAEMLRLFEYTIAPTTVISTEDGKRLFDRQLKENYGHAGDKYAQYLVNNLEEVVQAILNIQDKIDKELRLTPPERFWSAVAACNLAGGLAAKRLGLHDYDMMAIYRWTTATINSMREEIKPPAEDTYSIIGDYINRHMQNILVVKDEVDSRSTAKPLPTLEPKGDLLIRYEPDTKRMYFVTKDFKNDCVDQQISYKDTLKELKEKGFYEGTVNKRMSKGMKITSPAVNAIMFDCSTGFVNMDELIAPEVENAHREVEL